MEGVRHAPDRKKNGTIVLGRGRDVSLAPWALAGEAGLSASQTPEARLRGPKAPEARLSVAGRRYSWLWLRQRCCEKSCFCFGCFSTYRDFTCEVRFGEDKANIH